jgi:hypothetical protein
MFAAASLLRGCDGPYTCDRRRGAHGWRLDQSAQSNTWQACWRNAQSRQTSERRIGTCLFSGRKCLRAHQLLSNVTQSQRADADNKSGERVSPRTGCLFSGRKRLRTHRFCWFVTQRQHHAADTNRASIAHSVAPSIAANAICSSDPDRRNHGTCPIASKRSPSRRTAHRSQRAEWRSGGTGRADCSEFRGVGRVSWAEHRLGDIVKFRSGGTPRKSEPRIDVVTLD